jgi:excisionase family DNA binding protein
MDEITSETASRPPLLHDMASAARALSMTPRGVYQLVTEGKIRSVKVGRRRLIPNTALTEFVANLEAKAA